MTARALRTASLTEPNNISDWLKYEPHGAFGRELVTLLSGAGNLKSATVIGKITKGAVSVAAKSGGNTGAGTCTLDVTTPKIAGAKVGVYQVRFTAAATDSGRYQVIDPDGIMIGTALVGATFANQIKFVIADVSTDFIVGDGFDITIAAGSLKFKKHINGAFDGTETAWGILIANGDATSADVTNVIALRRGPAEVSRRALIWDSSVDSESKKDAALASLLTQGIVAMVGA